LELHENGVWYQIKDNRSLEKTENGFFYNKLIKRNIRGKI